MKVPNLSEACHSFVLKLKQVWKPLLVGQLLSILLAASGAANDTLHFDCNLSAPSLQAGLIYFFFLSFASFRMIFESRRIMSEEDVDDERGGLSSSSTHSRTPYANERNLHRGDQLDNDDDDDIQPSSTCDKNPCICARFSQSNTFCSFFPIQGSLKMYFIMAVLDLEGNYFTFLAFRYTTLTSVSLLDALAIPSAMVFSRFMLRRRYGISHFIGALICISGIVVNVYADSKDIADDNGNNIDQDDAYIENEFPNQIRGDFYAILGAIIYGLNDVLTERAVKHIGGVREYQIMIGLLGTFVAIVQGIVFDRGAVQDFFKRDDDVCSSSKAFSILIASGIFGVASYVGISNFLVESEAAFLNLSLLTGDLWAVVFSIFVQSILPSSMFWLALVLIVVGVFIYELSDSPIIDDADIEYDSFHDNGLIQQSEEGVTAHHLRELEMPDEII